MIHVLEQLSPLFVGICTFLGVRYSSKVNAKATQEGAEMQDDLNWRKQLTEEVEKLKVRIDGLEAEIQLRGKKIGVLGDFLDALSIYLLYGRTGPFPEPPGGGAEEHYERSRYVLLKDRYESEEAARQQRAQKQQ